MADAMLSIRLNVHTQQLEIEFLLPAMCAVPGSPAWQQER